MSIDAQSSSTSAAAAPTALPVGWRVPASLLVLAAPIIGSMISRTLMSFADFYMVSYLGVEAQAAIMPAGLLLFCVLGFGMGALSAVNTYVSQCLGREDRYGCAAYAWQGVYLSLLLGLLALPSLPVVGMFFEWVGHEKRVAEMETVYVQIGLLGLAPAMAAMALGNFAQGIHRPAIGLWAMVAANLFNVLANFALIFGMWGFPRLGIAGAAIATQVSGLLQALILLAWMLQPSLAAAYHTRRAWRLDLPRLRSLIWIGTPAGIQFVVDIVSFTIFTLFLIGRFGTVQLAANNITFKLLELSFMPVFGLGAALTVAVGHAIGMGRPDHARLLTRWCFAFAVAWMGTAGLSFVLFGHEFAGLMVHDEATSEAVTDWAALLLLFCAVFQVFDAMTITHLSALRGAGDNHWPAIAAAGLAAVVLLGGGFFLASWRPQWGAAGPWLAATIYACIYGVVMWSRWTFGPWERIDVFSKDGHRSPDAADTPSDWAGDSPTPQADACSTRSAT
jgi:MATE family multidrug resistance protein